MFILSEGSTPVSHGCFYDCFPGDFEIALNQGYYELAI
jgi:hypothetical protein